MTPVRTCHPSAASPLLLVFWAACLCGCGSSEVGTADRTPVTDVVPNDAIEETNTFDDGHSTDDDEVLVDIADAPSSGDNNVDGEGEGDSEADDEDRCEDPALSTIDNPAKPCPCLPPREGGNDRHCCARNVAYTCSRRIDHDWAWITDWFECIQPGDSEPPSDLLTPCPWRDDPFSID